MDKTAKSKSHVGCARLYRAHRFDLVGAQCAPYKAYNGFPMGTTALNDNARVLNGTSCTVAGFKARPPLSGKKDITPIIDHILND